MKSIELFDFAVLAGETVLKVSLILILAWFACNLLRRKYPSGAHLAWVIGFCAVFAVPLLSSVLPWKSVLYLHLDPSRVIVHRQQPKAQAVPMAVGSNVQNTPYSTTPPAADPTGPSQPPELLLLLVDAPWLLGLCALWLTGFLAIAARSAYGLYSLRLIRRLGTTPVRNEGRLIRAAQLAREAGVNRRFNLRICKTDELPVPMTWGVLRPTVVLPKEADSWTDKRFEATMLHELSHVRRFDFLSQILAELICALYWFNPLAWLGARTMRSDAELAADEAVLHSGLKASDYAQELLLLAAHLGNRTIPFARVGTPAMTNSKIETRLESILSPSAGHRGITSIQVLAALALAALAIPTFASFHASAHGQAGDPADERHAALTNAKQMGLATIMYANDYDDYYPYVQQTASAVEVLRPYTKNVEVFKSPTKGGRFLYNLNIGGVSGTAIEFPAQTPMWIESLPDPKMSVAVAFTDGHAKLIPPTGMPDIKKAASQHFSRDKKMRPLPPNYLLPPKSTQPYMTSPAMKVRGPLPPN